MLADGVTGTSGWPDPTLPTDRARGRGGALPRRGREIPMAVCAAKKTLMRVVDEEGVVHRGDGPVGLSGMSCGVTKLRLMLTLLRVLRRCACYFDTASRWVPYVLWRARWLGGW